MTGEFWNLTQDQRVTCIFVGVVALVGFLGNGLLLRALVKYRSLHCDFFVLLGSVAVADILYLIIAVPSHIIYLTDAMVPVNDVWCKSSKYIKVGSSFVVACHLVILAVLRGILLIIRGRNPPTSLQTLVYATVLWVITFLASIPFLMMREDVGWGYCVFTEDADKRDVLLINSFSCYVPVCLILVIYLTTHLVGLRYFKDSYSYKERQMSRLVTVIVVLFVLMLLPYYVMDTLMMYKELEAEEIDYPDEEDLESLYITRNYLLILMVADKAVRPIICAMLAPSLSEAFFKVIKCIACQQSYAPPGTTSHSASISQEALKDHRDSGRHPSTSSKAPLMGMSEGKSCSEPAEAVDELGIVHL